MDWPTILASALLLVVGAAISLAGGALTDLWRDRRTGTTRQRANQRETLLLLSEAVHSYEDATGNCTMLLGTDWNDQPPQDRVWHMDELAFSQEFQQWTSCSRRVTALRAAVVGADLRALVEQFQEETFESLKQGPASPSAGDMVIYQRRAKQRVVRWEQLMDALGRATRDLE
jgi:hypothetical protein